MYRPILASFLILLAGCAAQPAVLTPDRAAAWLERRVQLSGLDEWRLSGRIAVRIDREAFSASLFWQQSGEDYTLRVAAPLGGGTYELSGGAGGVRLQTADNRLLYAEDPEALMQENLGWQLPVSGLVYWIRGLPEPDVTPSAMVIDDQGRLNDIDQNGWQVRYKGYQTSDGVELPDRMELRKDRLRVRFVISDWSLER